MGSRHGRATKDTQITLRMLPTLHERASRCAAASGLDLPGFLRNAIVRECERVESLVFLHTQAAGRERGP